MKRLKQGRPPCMFSLVTTLARRHVFKYTFSIARERNRKAEMSSRKGK